MKLMELGYTASKVRIAALMKDMGLVCNAERKTPPEYRRTYAYSGHGFAVNKKAVLSAVAQFGLGKRDVSKCS